MWRIIKSITRNQTEKHTSGMHRRQGQFIGFHFLIALLKEATESTFLISTGTSSQILGARWDNISEPKVTDFIDLE